MKKVIFALVCVFCATLTASAQYSFSQVAKVVDHKTYAVVIGENGLELGINPFLHERLVKRPNDYLLLDVQATGGSTRTIIHKDMISEWIVEVDTVEYVQAYDMAAVKFTDGTCLITPQLEWLKVQPGQHADRRIFVGETKVVGQVKTVDRSEPLHEGNKPQHWEARAKGGRLLGALILPGEPMPALSTEGTPMSAPADLAQTTPPAQQPMQQPAQQPMQQPAQQLTQTTPPAQQLTQQPMQQVKMLVANTQQTKHVAIRN